MVTETATTRALLGLLAAVSVLQAVMLAAFAIAAFVIYRRLSRVADDLEARQLVPAIARVRVALDRVEQVSALLRRDAERVDHRFAAAVLRVDEAAGLVRQGVQIKISPIVGVIRGARTAIESLLSDRDAHVRQHETF